VLMKNKFLYFYFQYGQFKENIIGNISVWQFQKILLTASHRLLSKRNLLRYPTSKSLVSEVLYSRKNKIYSHYVRRRMQNRINYERWGGYFLFSRILRAHTAVSWKTKKASTSLHLNIEIQEKRPTQREREKQRNRERMRFVQK